jgi:uncharacterized metal-binding protein
VFVPTTAVAPVGQAYVAPVAGVADNVEVGVAHEILFDELNPAVNVSLIVTDFVAVAVQPFVPVTVTVYTCVPVVAVGLAVMVAMLAAPVI